MYTIGHSTRPIDEFVALLREFSVDLLVDVRSIPRSRTNPQFNADALPESLAASHIGYHRIASLGGRRHHRKGAPPSVNTMWRVTAFRNYADHAATPEFREGLDELLKLAAANSCAIMCAEAVWWRCHRRIIADYLIARRTPVIHIMGPAKSQPATLTPGARVLDNGTIVYSGTATQE